MSLISLRNVLEPVTNKVHLITLFLLVLIFMVLRLSNGGLHFQSNIKQPKLQRSKSAATATSSQPVSRLTIDDVQEETPATARSVTQATRGTAPSRATQDENSGFLDSLIAPTRKEEPVKEAPAPKRGGLEDIERELGLR